MLAEKYRPQRLDDIIGQDKIVNYYKKLLREEGVLKNHYIFTGDTGIGKTSMAHAIAYEFDMCLLEYNASDDRSLNFIRETIIPSMKNTSITGKRKLILLDETENMLRDALFCLRTPMERYKNAVIIFSCNNTSNIDSVKAIKSRCITFEFKKISEEDIRKRLQEIIKLEGMKVNKDIIKYISKKAGGDLRYAINMLEEKNYSDTDEIYFLY